MKEIELKLQILGELSWGDIVSFPEISALIMPESNQNEQLKAMYYDTPMGSLAKAGFVYRTRLENDTWIATIKRGGSGFGGLHQRDEWQVQQENGTPNLQAFREFEFADDIVNIDSGTLEVLLATTFSREKCLLKGSDGSIIEFAFDNGLIEAGDKQKPIAEIELELKEGSIAEVLKIGHILSTKYPLLLESQSKFARGLSLLGEKAQKKEKISIRREDTLKEAFKNLLSNGLFALVEAHQKLSILQTEKEIQNFRIQVRVLRSLVEFAKQQMSEEVFHAFDKWIEQLGQSAIKIREIDTMLYNWQEAKQGVPDFGEMFWLDDFLEKKKKAEIELLIKGCNPCAFTPHVLKLWEMLLEDRVFLPDKGDMGAYLEAWMIAEFSSFRKKFKEEKEHEGIRELSKQGETIGYIMEATKGLLDSRIKRVNDKLRAIQVSLGELYDFYITTEYFQEILQVDANRDRHRNVGALVTWQAKILKIGNQLPKDFEELELAIRGWQK